MQNTLGPMEALFGDTLQKGKETVATGSALGGKTAVGLYFSAHWCGPCRGFTPKLAEIYKDLVAAGKSLEIVFVSSDRDEKAFDDYFAEMPWLALPYAERKLKATLSKKYKVRGIPTFVIVDGETGELITTDGRSAVMEDPKGAKFPWKPPTLWEALGDEVLKGTEGDTVEVSDLRGKGKVLGLYFSAHWCGPCRGFTPSLVKTYNSLKAQGKDFEIIFCSSDRGTDAFREYYGTMPWLAIPSGDPRKETLSRMFDVEGIPTFVLIDAETGKTINANGRGAVGADPEGADYPWAPKPVNDLSSPDGINDTTALCALVDGCDADAKAAAKAVLTPIAEASKAAGTELLFFVATSGDGAVPQVRKLTGVGAATATAQMILLDIPDDGGFYVAPDGPITAESVTSFLDKYKEGGLERKQLG